MGRGGKSQHSLIQVADSCSVTLGTSRSYTGEEDRGFKGSPIPSAESIQSIGLRATGNWLLSMDR